MGMLYFASCRCGYAMSDYNLGVGMMGAGYSLYECQNCNSLLQSSDGTKYRRCSSCGSSILRLIDPEADQLLVCPECKNRTLQLNEAGLWD